MQQCGGTASILDEGPPLGSILRLFEVPSNGGDTLFSSMYAAYDALSEAMKELLGKLSAMHDGGPNYIDRAKNYSIQCKVHVW